jgi:hypothetical protein
MEIYTCAGSTFSDLDAHGCWKGALQLIYLRKRQEMDLKQTQRETSGGGISAIASFSRRLPQRCSAALKRQTE